MKCREIQPWLLSSRAMGPLPVTVQRHLDECSRCRRMRTLLTRLDEQVCQLPLPPANPMVKAQLWERIDALPVASVATPSRSFRTRLLPFGRMLAAATAASILIGLGWFLGRQTTSSRPAAMEQLAGQPSDKDKIVTARSREAAVVVRVVKHDVRLAEAMSVEEQLDTLNLLAGDLKDEAFRLVQQGSPGETPMVVRLYEQVLRNGLVRRAVSLPEDKKAAIVGDIVRKLRSTDEEVRLLARNSLPVVAGMLKPIGNAARESSNLLEAGRSAEEIIFPETSLGSSTPLLVSLVLQGLKLADENDPLRRADLCSELALFLAPNVVLLSARGDEQLAGEMGACLGELLDRGVEKNLGRAESADAKGSRLEESQAVRGRSEQAVVILEQNLSSASPEARAGIERAVEASNSKHDRTKKAGKGKGKPEHSGTPSSRGDKNETGDSPSGKSFVPPGLQKEKEKEDKKKKEKEKDRERD